MVYWHHPPFSPCRGVISCNATGITLFLNRDHLCGMGTITNAAFHPDTIHPYPPSWSPGREKPGTMSAQAPQPTIGNRLPSQFLGSRVQLSVRRIFFARPMGVVGAGIHCQASACLPHRYTTSAALWRSPLLREETGGSVARLSVPVPVSVGATSARLARDFGRDRAVVTILHIPLSYHIIYHISKKTHL